MRTWVLTGLVSFISTHTVAEFGDYRAQECCLTDGGVPVVLNSTRPRGCITVTLTEDNLLEEPEFFTINLVYQLFRRGNSEVVGANIVLNPNQTVVDILDNTGKLIADYCIPVVLFGACCVHFT